MAVGESPHLMTTCGASTDTLRRAEAHITDRVGTRRELRSSSVARHGGQALDYGAASWSLHRPPRPRRIFYRVYDCKYHSFCGLWAARTREWLCAGWTRGKRTAGQAAAFLKATLWRAIPLQLDHAVRRV